MWKYFVFSSSLILLINCKTNQASKNFSDMYPNFKNKGIDNFVIMDSVGNIVSKKKIDSLFFSLLDKSKGKRVKYYPIKKLIFFRDTIAIDTFLLSNSNYFKYRGSTFELHSNIW